MPKQNFVIGVLDSLPDLLINERVRLGLTQKQLAERVGIHEQQIQKYEASRYRSAKLERLKEVAAALFED